MSCTSLVHLDRDGLRRIQNLKLEFRKLEFRMQGIMAACTSTRSPSTSIV